MPRGIDWMRAGAVCAGGRKSRPTRWESKGPSRLITNRVLWRHKYACRLLFTRITCARSRACSWKSAVHSVCSQLFLQWGACSCMQMSICILNSLFAPNTHTHMRAPRAKLIDGVCWGFRPRRRLFVCLLFDESARS